MKFVFSILIAMASTRALADSITIPLGQNDRGKEALPKYILECKNVLKGYIAVDVPAAKEPFNFILKDLDQNAVAKYLWWSVTDKDGKEIFSKLMQKPVNGDCF